MTDEGKSWRRLICFLQSTDVSVAVRLVAHLPFKDAPGHPTSLLKVKGTYFHREAWPIGKLNASV